MIPDSVLEAIKKPVSKIVKIAESLQLSSIAKAIEQVEHCQIFIDRWKGELTSDFASCIATSETCVLRETGRPPLKRFVALPIRHHFIFYTPCPTDPEVERILIAHELGHCALHWPLNEREERLVWGDNIEQPDLYVVRYTKEEEQEADAFQCLVTANRPKPVNRTTDIEVTNQVRERVEECAEKGLLHSMVVS